MSVVNNENIDLAAWYVNLQHSRCCCKPSYPELRCQHCKPTFQICCLMATVGTNERKHYLARYTGLDATPWEAGDPCDYLGSHNLCGSLRTLINTGTECMASLHLSWDVAADCETVRVTLSNGSSGLGDSVSQDLGRQWYTSPITFTAPFGGPDVTIENCPVPTTVLPVVGTTGINIVGERWAYAINPGDPNIRLDPRTRATGNDICGSTQTCPGEGLDWNWYCHLLSWRMLDDLETIEFRIEFSGLGVCSGGATITHEVPWGTGLNGTGVGDWFEPANLPIIIPVAGGYWKLGRVEGCGTSLDCEPYDCYPLCVVNTCPGDPPDTVNAISPTLSWDGIDIGYFEYSVEDGWSFVLTDPFSGWEAQLYCTTPGVPADGQTLFIDPPIEWDGPTSWVIHMSCTGGTMDDVVIEVSVPPETVVITLTV